MAQMVAQKILSDCLSDSDTVPVSMAIEVSLPSSEQSTGISSESEVRDPGGGSESISGSGSTSSASPSSPVLPPPAVTTSTKTATSASEVFGMVRLIKPKHASRNAQYIPKIRIKLMPPKSSNQQGQSGSHPKLRQLLFNSSSSMTPSGPVNGDVMVTRRLSPRRAASRLSLLNSASSRLGGGNATGRGTVDLENPDSAITQCNLRGLVNKATFAALPLSYQNRLLRLLPASDVVYENGSQPRIHPSALNNEFFTKALQEFRERLSRGEFRPAAAGSRQAAAAAAARETQSSSSGDAWKDAYFEEYWGQRLGAEAKKEEEEEEQEQDEDEEMQDEEELPTLPRQSSHQETAASVAGAAGGLLAAAAQAMEQASAAVEAAAAVAAAAEATVASTVASTTPPATPPSPECGSTSSSSPADTSTTMVTSPAPNKPSSLPTPPTDDDTPTFVKPKGVPPPSRGKPGGKPPLRTVVAGKPAGKPVAPANTGKPSPPGSTSRLLIKRTATGELTSLLSQQQSPHLLSMVPAASPTPAGNRPTRTLASMREKIRAKRMQNEARRAAASATTVVPGDPAPFAGASSTSSGSEPASPSSPAASGCSSSCDSSPLASPQLPATSNIDSTKLYEHTLCRGVLPPAATQHQMYLIQTQPQRDDGTPAGQTQSILVYRSPATGGQLQLLAAPAALQLQQQLATATAASTKSNTQESA